MPPEPPRPDLTQLSDIDKDRLIDVLFARMDALEAKLSMKPEFEQATILGWTGQEAEDQLAARQVWQGGWRPTGA